VPVGAAPVDVVAADHDVVHSDFEGDVALKRLPTEIEHEAWRHQT
jgi:hypothetical protein